MDFWLTYSGPLQATQRDPLDGQPPKHAQNRKDIRRCFHHQLKRLWDVAPALNGKSKTDALLLESSVPTPATSIADLSHKHARYGFNFVPLVTSELDLLCELDVLMLRPDRPGAVWDGDIDNRVKTLFDAMSVPVAGENYASLVPQQDEQPFFVLLEDDKLLTKISVTTDRLLQSVPGDSEKAAVRLFIHVKTRPYAANLHNLHFA